MDPLLGGTEQSANRPRRSMHPPLVVLFVDPEATRAEQLARLLPQPASVGFVPTASAAIQAVSQYHIDLVITQLDLPDLFGVDLIARLHSMPAARQTLVMVVTERAAVRDKIAAFKAGADDYVVSPMAPDAFTLRVQLLSRLRSHLRR